MSARLDPWLLQTDAGRAAAAAAWAHDMQSLEDIGSAFGFKTGSQVCRAIRLLIAKYAPEAKKLPRPDGGYSRTTPIFVTGDRRKRLAITAIRNYVVARELGDAR